ncbi:MAG: DUF92 domain-containing protein [Nitrososphaerales archaeon]
MVLETLLGVVIVTSFALLGYRFKAFDLKGIIAGLILVYFVLFSTGLRWVLIVLAFVIVGSLFTKFGKNKKRLAIKDSVYFTRSWRNVLGNGMVPAIFSGLEMVSSIYKVDGSLFVIAFGSSLATACADTLATEIGLLSKEKPRYVLNPKKYAIPGSSGGITGLGTLASLLGSSIIALVFIFVRIMDSSLAIFLALLFSGFLGSLVDSILGQTLQFKGLCSICNEEIENKIHHKNKAKRIKGIEVIDNNVVNLLAGFFGAIFGIVIYLLLR